MWSQLDQSKTLANKSSSTSCGLDSACTDHKDIPKVSPPSTSFLWFCDPNCILCPKTDFLLRCLFTNVAAEETPTRHCLTPEPRWKDLVSGLPHYWMCTSFPENVPNSHWSHILQEVMLLVARQLIRKDKIRKKLFIFCGFVLFCCCCCRTARKSFQTRFGESEWSQFSFYGCFFPLINQPSALLPVYHGGDLISIKLLTTAVIISASQFMR